MSHSAKANLPKHPISSNPQSRLKRRRDGSTLYRGLEPAMVVRTLSTVNAQNLEIRKTILATTRTPEIGDKYSSRHGQKGVLVSIIDDEDMPVDSEGQRPDIIINPHALPTRMTAAQLLESLRGLGCALEGTFADATAYRQLDLDAMGDILHRNGMPRRGERMFKDGRTGKMFEGTVFCGVVHTQKLKHLTVDKTHARSTGPKQLLIRQPNEGRSKDGGQRFGEMERDCIIGKTSNQVKHEVLFFFFVFFIHSLDYTFFLVFFLFVWF